MTTTKEYVTQVKKRLISHGGSTFIGRPYSPRENYHNVFGNWVGMVRNQLSEGDISPVDARRKLTAFNRVLQSRFGQSRMKGKPINVESELKRFAKRA